MQVSMSVPFESPTAVASSPLAAVKHILKSRKLRLLNPKSSHETPMCQQKFISDNRHTTNFALKHSQITHTSTGIGTKRLKQLLSQQKNVLSSFLLKLVMEQV
jgi:hypothetical protein